MQTFRDIEKHLGLVPAHTAAALAEVSAGRGREDAFRKQHPQVLEGLMEIARIQSSESSNAIEHITAPAERIAELVQDKTTPKNRPEEEIAGYRKVLDMIHASADHIPIKPSVVQQFHRDLYAFTATPGGHFKNSQNEVARFGRDGKKIEVIFEGTPPFETPGAMDELHERFAEAIVERKHSPLLLSGAYVFDFLMIHPFNDGNGRLSRLLTLLLLYRSGHEIGRFISLERLVEESKETYYESLERSTRGWAIGEHDIWPWLNYFLGILSAAYKEFEERAGEIKSGRGSKAKRIRRFVQSHSSESFTFDEIQRALPDISADHIRTELRKLRDADIVRSPGRGRKKWQRLP
ncbi:MAG TPA: Fic family protein [Solirubrobacterales bacterium]|jgi:Fic family protein|nr:Fic family protein [Solirubrobacterales bacterium]